MQQAALGTRPGPAAGERVASGKWFLPPGASLRLGEADLGSRAFCAEMQGFSKFICLQNLLLHFV